MKPDVHTSQDAPKFARIRELLMTQQIIKDVRKLDKDVGVD
jgi:hypothetical protein